MTETALDRDGLTFLDYLRPVWRFKVIVVLVVVLAAAATYFLVNRQEKIYQSTSDVFVGQSTLEQVLNPAGALQLSTTAVANQALQLATPQVARVVRHNLRLTTSPQALLGEIAVVPSSTTDLLTITATSPSPQLAAALANGFAQAYFQLAGGNLLTSARGSLKATETRLQQLAPDRQTPPFASGFNSRSRHWKVSSAALRPSADS